MGENRGAQRRRSRPTSHHLDVCDADSSELERHLAFRDYLRANPKAFLTYATLKKNLADKFRSDREGYANAKSPFIQKFCPICRGGSDFLAGMMPA
ncbi:GrpB family protein [Rhizobium mongolense]|uniref:GrpB family protein n=1 Tax=Rhizobium mongolense TaxID=57676 RepID=UPI00355679A1